MIPTEEQINQLRQSNWKAERLLCHYGSYDKLPENLKLLVQLEIEKPDFLGNIDLASVITKMKGEIGIK